MEKINNNLPNIIIDHRVARSELEQQYIDLVRKCHLLGEWYPEATMDQMVGAGDHNVSRPMEDHPVLSDEKYHRYKDTDQPLNLRGRKKLSWMQYKYDKAVDIYWEITMTGYPPISR